MILVHIFFMCFLPLVTAERRTQRSSGEKAMGGRAGQNEFLKFHQLILFGSKGYGCNVCISNANTGW